jgi:phosphopantothenoylcysteine synthetase/decarboxylase
MAETAKVDICLVPAAIADFAPKKRVGKIATRDGPLTLSLDPTPKVLGVFRKATKGALVGFKAVAGVDAAELKTKAMALAKEADLDFVVANDVAKVGRETTAVTIFDRKGGSATFEGSKALVAERIWRAVLHGVTG